MPGSTARTGRAGKPGRPAPATVGTHAWALAAPGHGPATTLHEWPGGRRRRLQEPRRARDGHLGRCPAALACRGRWALSQGRGERRARLRRSQGPARGWPGCQSRGEGRGAGARGRLGLSRGRWPSCLCCSRGCGAGVHGRLGLSRGRWPGRPCCSRGCGARVHGRPGPFQWHEVFRPGNPCYGWDRGVGARGAGGHRRLGLFRGREGGRPGYLRCGRGRAVGVRGRLGRSWMAGKARVGLRSSPGARRDACPARSRWSAGRRHGYPAKAPPQPRTPGSRIRAALRRDPRRERSHPARQRQPGRAGADHLEHPDSPWRERILLRA
jgi:hypothetical protein